GEGEGAAEAKLRAEPGLAADVVVAALDLLGAEERGAGRVGLGLGDVEPGEEKDLEPAVRVEVDEEVVGERDLGAGVAVIILAAVRAEADADAEVACGPDH